MPSVDLFDRESIALSTSTVMAIEGTYGAGCLGHSGSWAIALNGYTFISGETQLSVVENNAACTLSVTEVKAGAVLTPQVFQPSGHYALTTTYATTGLAFLLNGTGATQFYANFSVTPNLSFSAAFVIQMVFSDNVSETDLSNISSYIVEVASATAAPVPAPNASLNLTGLYIGTNFQNVVTWVSGGIILTQGAVVASACVVDTTLDESPSYGSVAAVYNADTKVTLSGAYSTIPGSLLNLIGLNLTTPQKVNIIAADVQSGVTSFQIFEITFNDI